MIRTVGIAKRSLFSFGILGIVTLLLGVFASIQLNLLKYDVDVISEQWLPAVINTENLQRDFLGLRLSAMEIYTAQSSHDLDRVEGNISDWQQKLLQSDNALQAFVISS